MTTNPSIKNAPIKNQRLHQLTDRCVKCGLCLPHCPTYELLRDEGESPRGRIALIQGWNEGRLPLNDKLESHLDRCLVCGACSRVCPSAVDYTTILTTARAQIELTRKPTLYTRILRHLGTLLVSRKKLSIRLQPLLRIGYQRSGLQRLLRASGALRLFGLKRLDQLLPKLKPMQPLARFTPAVNSMRGDVALFTGCTGATLDNETLQSAIILLTNAGFNVHIPDKQGCCGALHHHRGLAQQAQQFKDANTAAFNDAEDNMMAIIHVASGCGKMLAQYSADNRFTAPVMEICAFLHQQGFADSILSSAPNCQPPQFKPLAKSAVLHSPCTQPNTAPTLALLGLIPELDIKPLPGKDQCCGAAGSYMLSQASISDALRKQTLKRLPEQTDYLLSSNLGCALQLAAECDEGIEVCHPVTLLARQLI